MTPHRLFSALTAAFGPPPDTYLVLDVETSGVSPAHDWVVQVGHCLVVDRVAVATGSAVLDWTRGRETTGVTDADLRRLRGGVDRVVREMARRGLTCRLPWGRLRADGEDPVPVLAAYAGWVEEAAASGRAFVMHNGGHFDCPFLARAFAAATGRPTPASALFPAGSVWDTGALLKAAQADMLPAAGDTLRSFSGRVTAASRRGVKWSLNEFAVPAYRLAGRCGLAGAGHDAGYDALACHLLFEELRARAADPSRPLFDEV